MPAARLNLTTLEFAVEEVPIPEPGPDEVLVAVAAAGVCLSDLHLIDGTLRVWNNDQPKLTPSFPRQRWTDETVRTPDHGTATRRALAEAFALVDAGRSAEVRDRLVRTISAEPAIAGPWLRALVTELRC